MTSVWKSKIVSRTTVLYHEFLKLSLSYSYSIFVELCIFTKDLSWKHQDLTWKERYPMISVWTDLAGWLCQYLDINPCSHRDWGNAVIQTSNSETGRGLEKSVQALTRSCILEGTDVVFLQAGLCWLTGVINGAGLH